MSPQVERTFSTNEVSKRFKVSLRQLQWWDEKRIVHPLMDSHQRVWTASDLREVQLIRDMRRKGVRLRQIRLILPKLQSYGTGFLLLEKGYRRLKWKNCPDAISLIKSAGEANGPVIVIEIPKEQYA